MTKKDNTYIRALWGTVGDHTNRYTSRRTKIVNDIKLVLQNPYEPPFECITFGRENHKILLDNGVNSTIVDSKPLVWDSETQMFRHKIEAFKCGLETSERIIFLDWDCIPRKPIPADIWDRLAERANIQAILRIYHRRKCHWREENLRKAPCASCVYINGLQIAHDLIQTWEDMGRPWSEETTMAKYIDGLMGGFDERIYYENYEMRYFDLFEGGLLHKDNSHIFQHYKQGDVASKIAK